MLTIRLSLLALPVLALGLLAPATLGQCPLYTFAGDSEFDRFGRSVSGAGDVNGDGFADLIVGARWNDNNGGASGSAFVFSGLDGSIIYTFDGDSGGVEFGWSVSGAGDVNADGFDDMIVGAWFDSNNGDRSGSARVFSGVDGSVLYTFDGDSKGDRLGHSVSGAGDVNGDGFDDLIVGAYGDDPNGSVSGSARVFSGVDGSVLYTFDGDSELDRFGWAVSGAGDVNGDGFADLIVATYAAGLARVFSGVDGTVLYDFAGVGAFGWSVGGGEDVNGDGYDDLVVGAPGANSSIGSARVFSGVDGSVLYTFDGDSAGDLFGGSVSFAGDVNGDGFAEIIVGGDANSCGGTRSAQVFSGVDGSLLHTFCGDSPGDGFADSFFGGTAVSGAGDVNGDGFADLIVGAYLDDNNGTDSGSASVFSGRGSVSVGTSYCGPAVPNSTGLPASILALGSETVTDDHLCLRATDLPLNEFGYFLASETQGFIANPGGSQGNLCLGGKIGRFAKQIQESGKSGTLMIQVDLTSLPMNPPHTVLAGETWNFQGWYRDRNPGATSNFTDAVSVTFL